MSDERKFNPKEHMRVFERRQRQLDGSYKTVKVDYLDVKWRIVWFREEHPHGSIVTELLSEPVDDPAVVKATVSYWTDDGNQVIATGMGRQGKDDWSDFLEKAETRAIGRALGALGYGTQFSEGFEDVVADSPTERPARQQAQSSSRPAAPRSNGNGGSKSADPMTPNQQNFMFRLVKEAGVSDEFEDIVRKRYGHGVTSLTKAEASQIIDMLQELKNERQQQPEEGDSGPFDRVPAKPQAPAAKQQPAGWDFDDKLNLEVPEAPDESAVPTDKQIDAMLSLQKRQQMSDRELISVVAGVVGREITSLVEITESEAAESITVLNAI